MHKNQIRERNKFTLQEFYYQTVLAFSQVFISFFLTICTVLFYFSVSCFVTVIAVLLTTLVLLLLINLDLDSDLHKTLPINCTLVLSLN